MSPQQPIKVSRRADRDNNYSRIVGLDLIIFLLYEIYKTFKFVT